MALDNDGGAAGAGGAGGAGAGGGVADLLDGGAGAGGAGAGAGGEGAGAGGEGAGAGAGTGDGGAGGDPAFLEQLSAEAGEGESASLRDWAKAANVKDVNALAKIARDSMAALRESGRVKVPGEGASEAEVKAFRSAIGVPDAPDGYVIEPPKGADGQPLTGEDGEPLKLDTPLLQRLAATAHANGLPKAGYEALVNDFMQFQLEQAAAGDVERQGEAREWFKTQGDAAPAKRAAVNRAAEALGLTGAEVVAIRGAIGSTRTLDTLAKLGEGISEDVFMGGGGGGQRFGMSGDQAQKEMDTMKADPAIAAKAAVPGTAENVRWKRLEAIVGDAANRKAAQGG